MSPLTAVLKFKPPTATGVRPVQALSRHFDCAVVRGVLGLTEPTATIEFEFFTPARGGISSSVLRAFGPTLALQLWFSLQRREITSSHAEVYRFQCDDGGSSFSEPPATSLAGARGNEQPTIEWIDEYGLTWLHAAPKIRLLPDHNRRQLYPLDWEEQDRLFRELPAFLAEMALFKVNTGCRDGEVCNLRAGTGR